MSSSRVSFGSRAGKYDYPGGQQEIIIRSSTHNGAYHSLDALADALRIEIAAAADGEVPECSTLELSLSAGAVLELVRPGVGPYADGGEHDLPPQFKHIEEEEVQEEDGNGTVVRRNLHPRAHVGDIINVGDGRQSAIVQRAASRGVIAAIEKADGFRYSFNNAWTAKDGEGSRFSYICQDSMQNKDRHANGYPRTTKHLKADVGSRGPRKPTYDCKGSVSIKFSTAKQRCDVYYRHYAIHATVADRASMPRPAAVRRPFVSRGPLVAQHPDDGAPPGQDGGGLLATLQAETYATSALAMVDRTEPSNIGRPLKRKRESMPPPPPPQSNPNKPLSLVELLSQSENATAPPPVSEVKSKQKHSSAPGPVAYDLPSWQTPPPPLNQPPAGAAPGGYPAPYQPPYQPAKNRTPSTPSIAQPQVQPTKPQPAFQQRSSGPPAASRPKAQGLFATLKPVPRSASTDQSAGGMYSSSAITYQNPDYAMPAGSPGYEFYRRAKMSCVRCRLGKRKCDEGQPCSACVKSGFNHDCVYEGGHPLHNSNPSNFTPGGNRLPWTQHDRPSPAPLNSAPTYPSTSAATPVQQLPWGTPVSQPSSTPDSSWRPPNATMSAAQRDASPDPWFPKR